MLRVHVFVTNVSGERYWDVEKPLPIQVQISINLNVVSLDEKNGTNLEARYIFTVNFTPSIAQITVRGKAVATGEKEEIAKVMEEYRENKAPMPMVQAIQNAGTAEAIIVSRTLGIPPPLPPLPPPPAAKTDSTAPMKYTA